MPYSYYYKHHRHQHIMTSSSSSAHYDIVIGTLWHHHRHQNLVTFLPAFPGLAWVHVSMVIVIDGSHDNKACCLGGVVMFGDYKWLTIWMYNSHCCCCYSGNINKVMMMMITSTIFIFLLFIPVSESLHVPRGDCQLTSCYNEIRFSNSLLNSIFKFSLKFDFQIHFETKTTFYLNLV